MKYVYLIAFGREQAYGSLTYTTPRKIKSNHAFEETQQELRKQTGYDDLAILSFQLIGKERKKWQR